MEVIFRGDQTNHNCLLTFSPFLWKERKENSDQYPSCVSAIIINFTEFSFLFTYSHLKLVPLKVSQCPTLQNNFRYYGRFCLIKMNHTSLLQPTLKGKKKERNKQKRLEKKTFMVAHLCISQWLSLLRICPAMWETRVPSLGWVDPLEERTATHSSDLAWKIPWMEEPGRIQSMQPTKSQTQLSDFTFFHFP